MSRQNHRTLTNLLNLSKFAVALSTLAVSISALAGSPCPSMNGKFVPVNLKDNPAQAEALREYIDITSKTASPSSRKTSYDLLFPGISNWQSFDAPSRQSLASNELQPETSKLFSCKNGTLTITRLSDGVAWEVFTFTKNPDGSILYTDDINGSSTLAPYHKKTVFVPVIE